MCLRLITLINALTVIKRKSENLGFKTLILESVRVHQIELSTLLSESVVNKIKRLNESMFAYPCALYPPGPGLFEIFFVFFLKYRPASSAAVVGVKVSFTEDDDHVRCRRKNGYKVFKTCAENVRS